MARPRGDRGASAVELTIVAPAVLLLIFATIQFALWSYGRNVALQSAREGVSRLRTVPSDSDTDAARRAVEDDVESYARQVGRESLLDPQATAFYDASGEGRVRVRVRGRVVTLVPGFDLKVDVVARGEIERFEPDEEL